MPVNSVSDPIERIVGALRGDRPWTATTIIIAVCAHVAVGRSIHLGNARGRERLLPAKVVDVDLLKPALPSRPTATPRIPASGSPKPSATPLHPRTRTTVAQAAAVLARTSDPNEPMDLTDGFATGSGSTYTGGATAAEIATKPVGASAASGRVVPAAAPAPVVPSSSSPDRSRRPSVAGELRWDCPFPAQADATEMSTAVVTLRVDVDPSGSVRAVAIVRDPGAGFGREAERCARTRAWQPALDRDGTPTDGTLLVNVRFDR